MSDSLVQGPIAQLPTRHGLFNIVIFRDENALDHALIFKGKIDDGEAVLTRIHSECLTGDAFGSLRCDCGPQLDLALDEINKKGRGALLYMRQEGRGIGLFNKIRAYELQDNGLDTVDANIKLGFPSDGRKYNLCALMLQKMGVKKVILMTNNPLKIDEISSYGIEVVDRVPLEIGRNKYNEDYLNTKEKRMGHMLHHQD